MKIKNNLVLGAVLGGLFPMLAYMLTNYSDIIHVFIPTKPAGLYILAIAINMVGVWIAYRNGKDSLGKGIVLTTFLAMLLAVFTKTVVI